MHSRRDFLAGGLAGGLVMATDIGTLWAANPSELQGYKVPAEDRPHQATIMMWPNSRKVYRDRYFLKMTQKTIATIANAIAEFEPVILLADAADHDAIRHKISAGVALWDIATEDLWARDAGPLFTLHPTKGLAISHLQFNGWGGKQVHNRDATIAAQIAERMAVPLLETGLTGEAGGVEHDGHDSLIAHRSSWVNRNRNTGGEAQIEAQLLAAYGAKQMIWSDGVYGQDITDYHIDSLVRFTGENRALINLPKTPARDDPFHQAALDTHAALLAAGVQVETIYEPVKRRVNDPEFVAAYANYYVCNGAVISAEFGDGEADELAQIALNKAYPGREILQLNVDALGELGGGIHCATQQVPLA